MAGILRALLERTARCAGAAAARRGRRQDQSQARDEIQSQIKIPQRRGPMIETINATGYGELIESATLKIQRLLPGPIERVWAYLTESELRRQWLASGEMEMRTGASFELVWHNDELTETVGERPEGFGPEHRMQSRIVAC